MAAPSRDAEVTQSVVTERDRPRSTGRYYATVEFGDDAGTTRL